MTIRVFYNYILVQFGIREILPSDVIRNKKVIDCGEPMCSIGEDKFIFSKHVHLNRARESVCNKLYRIANVLKSLNLQIMIYELYRDTKTQELLRQSQFINAQQHIQNTNDNLVKLVNKRVALVGGGHQTGGAVDLTICDNNGIPLDMGTEYLEFNSATQTRSKQITPTQRKNRSLLLTIMTNEGFCNYPAEWWHFSYGDKMWAAYLKKPYAIYDII